MDTDWIPTTDRLPDIGDVVLISVPQSNPPVWLGYFTATSRWLYPPNGAAVSHTVTAWMPLPEPFQEPKR